MIIVKEREYIMQTYEMNLNDIKKTIKKLQIPKEYGFKFDIEAVLTHDFSLIMSIRQDAGKTTQALLLGLVLNYLYGTTTEYMRSDNEQIRQAKIETMYDVIIQFKYVERLFDKFNTIIYKRNEKKFYLAHIDDKGVIDLESDKPLCAVHSLEEWRNLKSSYVNPNGDYLIFDEFMDTSRQVNRQVIELQHNISTITRYRPNARVVMLGNNQNKFCFWFEEFEIQKEIESLKFGKSFEKTTELGTTIYGTLIDLSLEKKNEIKNRKIRFSGFNTPKMNAFNGLNPWQGEVWKHIPDNEMLKKEYYIESPIYVYHRNRYILINLYYKDDLGYYCYLHFSNKPMLKDRIILTLEPTAENEIYGFGRFCGKEKVFKKIQKIFNIRSSNLFFYESNAVGDLLNQYIKESI